MFWKMRLHAIHCLSDEDQDEFYLINLGEIVLRPVDFLFLLCLVFEVLVFQVLDQLVQDTLGFLHNNIWRDRLIRISMDILPWHAALR